jgi:hypothetical protein
MELPNRPTKDPYEELPVKDFSYINTQNRPHKKSGRAGLWIVSGVVVLVILGAGAFLYGHYTKDKTTKSNETKSHKTVTAPKSTTTAPNITLTNYSSSVFNLTVNYPNTWTIAASGSTSMTITSPETAMTADTGKAVEGKTIVTVVNQGQIPAGYGSSSVAVLNSQDINFSKPTSSQAAQTYISFMQYPATTVKGGLDAIYMTGNNGYLKGDVVPSSIVGQVSPLVIVSFEQCSNQTCTSPVALTISSTMWNSSAFSTPILDILKSFEFS